MMISLIIDVNPPLANFASAASEVEENGGQVLIPLSLTPNGNAAGGVPITVQWTFTDAASAFEVVCFSGGVEIDNPASGSTCESVVEAGSSSADITVNSGDTAAAGAEVLELDIIDGNGYDLGATVNHRVNIVRPPDANFVAGTSEVQAEGGEVVIALRLSELVAVGAEPVTISWSFADGAAFGTNAECVDSSGNVITNADVLAAAASGNCRSVIPADGSDTAEITITANDDSTATDANLILTIGDGEGYSIGNTNPTHNVDLTPPPVVNFAEAGPTYVAHGDSTSGNAVEIRVALSSPTDERMNVEWSFDDSSFTAGAPVCPNEVVVGTTTTCTTEVQGNANFFDIVFNSDATSGVGNIGNRLAINLEDAVGYTLGTPPSHEVVINQRPSSAEFVEADSDVRSNGGQVLIPVRLANEVHALAQPVTISWSFANGAAFSTNATCFDSSGNPITDIAAATSGDCESVVDPSNQEAVITVNSNAGSSATAADLILNIDEGEGYVVGATDEHQVALFDTPDASFEAASSNLERGDGH